MNPSWPKIHDHLYRIFIIVGSELQKTNALVNLIKHQQDLDEICLQKKDPYKPKYQLLINNCQKVGYEYCKDPKAYPEY